ncbi:MAG: putative metal-binding motif-containing protein [Sandaracinaceae bacterium]|nr:putative metal-binding motif-containing protein [Sandaracinaceae bacterium]
MALTVWIALAGCTAPSGMPDSGEGSFHDATVTDGGDTDAGDVSDGAVTIVDGGGMDAGAEAGVADGAVTIVDGGDDASSAGEGGVADGAVADGGAPDAEPADAWVPPTPDAALDGAACAPVDCYEDFDGDGYAGGGPHALCACPPGHTSTPLPGTDCADWDAAVRPGAAEICNFGDEDCDGLVDEGVSVVCYLDIDNDTYAPAGASIDVQCPAVAGGRDHVGGCAAMYTNRAPENAATTDCDDTDWSVFPGSGC